jgi:hypothetical protein
MQTQILPLGRCMPHVSGRNVRRLLRSTTREFNSRLPNWEQACCKKGIFTCLARNHAYGGKLGIVFVAHIQDAWWFEFLMHAYVNKHEAAERAFNHPCVQLCVHAGVFTYVWYSSWHSMHACMHVYACVCASAHAYTCTALQHVHTCMLTLTRTSWNHRGVPVKLKLHREVYVKPEARTKNSMQNFFFCRKAETHTHMHTLAKMFRNDECTGMLDGKDTHTSMH